MTLGRELTLALTRNYALLKCREPRISGTQTQIGETEKTQNFKIELLNYYVQEITSKNIRISIASYPTRHKSMIRLSH